MLVVLRSTLLEPFTHAKVDMMMNPGFLALALGLSAAVLGCEQAHDPARVTAAATSPETYTYEVRGMSCQGCVNAIVMKVNKVAGVDSCKVDLDNALAVVVVPPEQEPEVHEAIVGLGYQVKPLEDPPPAS